MKRTVQAYCIYVKSLSSNVVLRYYMATFEFHFLSNRYNSVDVNVAVATDAGLITPIVSRADIKVGHLV